MTQLDSAAASRPPHLPWMDGWRGLALCSVLCSHFGGPFYLGRLGVDAFFVLSGTLISRMLYEHRQPLKPFFVRRAARILPAFLIYVAAIAALFGMSPDGPFGTRDLLATVTFLRTYWPIHPPGWPIDTVPFEHLWSLNVEEHSYLFMAIVATLVGRRVRLGALSMLAVAVACVAMYWHYRFIPPQAAMPYSARTECAAYPVVLGAGLHLLVLHRGSIRLARGWLALSFTVLAFVVGGFWGSSVSVPFLVVPTLLAAGFCLLSISNDPLASATKRLLANPAFTRMGVASFSIYLWQQPFHWHYRHGNDSTVFIGLMWLVPALLTGILAYALIERPARRWLVARFAPNRPLTFTDPGPALSR